jgi:riboflavin biosynthesis pyrimidine reductase
MTGRELPNSDWYDRFDALEKRKTSEAIAARIEPFTTEVDQPDASVAAIGNAWTRHLFDGSFYVPAPASSERPAANLVFVRSRDGDTVAKNPQALGGGEADKHLIYEGLSRVAADAVLGGHATIRDGELILSVWHPELVALRASLRLPRHPAQIVATLEGVDLDRGLMFNVPVLRVFIMTVARGAAAMRDGLALRPWIIPIVMADARDLCNAFRQLRALGVRSLSCIGGRTFAEQVLDAGLIQNVLLTTSAISAGEPRTPFYSKAIDGRVVVRKHGSGVDEGVVFEQLSLRPEARHP